MEESVDRSSYTLYIKGLATDLQLDDVIEKLKALGLPVVCVRMRYHHTKDGKEFTGSVFAELSTPEEVAKILTFETPMEVDGTVLTVKSISQYKEDQRKKRESKHADSNTSNAANGADSATKVAESSGDGKTTDRKAFEYVSVPFAENLLVRAENLPGNCSREILQQIIERCGGTIHYIDYSRGLDHAYIQLQSETAVKAKDICDKISAAFPLESSTDANQQNSLATDLLRILNPQHATAAATVEVVVDTGKIEEQEEKQSLDEQLSKFPNFTAVEGSQAEEEWKRIESARNERRSAMERRRSNHHHPHTFKVKRSRPVAAS